MGLLPAGYEKPAVETVFTAEDLDLVPVVLGGLLRLVIAVFVVMDTLQGIGRYCCCTQWRGKSWGYR